MKLKIVPLLALSATAAQARITSSHRTLQATNTNNDADTTTVITGTGVQDAEMTPEATSTSTIEVPNYTSTQCLQWLQGAFDADGDSSDGLSEAEFHSFLLTIEEPPYVREYFAQHEDYQSMPWMFKVVHKTLACRCEDLGLGDGCCTGEDPEVKFIGLKDDDEAGLSNLTEAQRGVAREYRADMCNSIAVVLDKFIPTPSPTAGPTQSPTGGPRGGPTRSPLGAGDTSAPTTFEAPTGPGSSSKDTLMPTVEEEGVSEVFTPEPTQAPVKTVAFECVDVSKCNESEPSKNEQSSGWDELGDCGPGATTYGLTTCPPPHDSAGSSYNLQDQVSMLEADVKTRVEINVVGSTLDYSKFDIGDTSKYFMAQDVLNDREGNDVLRHVISGFGQVAMDVFRDGGGENVFDTGGVTDTGKRRLWRVVGDGFDWSRKLQNDGTLGEMQTSQVTDIDCPGGLMYAPQGGACLNFKFIIFPDDQDQENVDREYDILEYAINNGRLYDAVVDEYPETHVTGLGNPGKGIGYSLIGVASDKDRGADPGTMTTTIPGDESGFPLWGIIVIVVAILIFPAVLIAMYVKRKRNEDRVQMARLAEYETHKRDLEVGDMTASIEGAPYEMNDGPRAAPVVIVSQRQMQAVQEGENEEGSESSEWSSSESDNEGAKVSSPKSSAGSALAAMGAAGAAASHPTGVIEAEIRALVQETNSPRSADELLTAYAGNEAVLLDHLRMAKAKQASDGDSNNAPKTAMEAEIRALVQETNSPRSADELLAAYAGNEEVLLDHLRTAKAKQASDGDSNNNPKAAMEAEIRALAQETNSPRSADELLAAYAGNEEALLNHLRKAKKNQASDGSINDPKAVVKAEICALVEETNSPRSADELLAAYAGNEETLLNHLRKAKENQASDGNSNDDPKAAMKAEIRTLVQETNSPRGAEELLTAYAGNEEALLFHLRKMKENQAVDSSRGFTPVEATAAAMALPAGGKEAIRAEVADIVEECDIPRTADQLMAAYEGREDVLLEHLRATRDKQRSEEAAAAGGASAAVAPATEPEPDTVMPSAGAAAAVVAPTAAAMAMNDDRHDDENGRSTPEHNSEHVTPLPSAGFISPIGEGDETSTSSDSSSESSGSLSDDESCISEPVSVEPGAMAPDLLSGPMPTLTAPGMIDQELMERMGERKDVEAPSPAVAYDAVASRSTTQVILDEETAQKMDNEMQTPGSSVGSFTPPSPGGAATVTAARNAVAADEYKNSTQKGIDRELLSQISKRSLRTKVAMLVAETNPGKSSEELLKAFEGREEDLIDSLTSLKHSQSKQGGDNSSGEIV